MTNVFTPSNNFIQEVGAFIAAGNVEVIQGIADSHAVNPAPDWLAHSDEWVAWMLPGEPFPATELGFAP
jgi:hypothetical protein